MRLSSFHFTLQYTTLALLVTAGFTACFDDETTNPGAPDGGHDAGTDGSSDGAPQADAASSDAGADADVTGDAGGSDAAPDAADTPPRVSRWLAFTNSVSVFAFDVATYPYDHDPTGAAWPTSIVLAGTDGRLPEAPWSPDGKQLVYEQAGSLYVRDMTGPAPSEPRLVASNFETGQVAWSTDSMSLVYISNGELFVADRAGLQPGRRVSATAKAFAWAPRGTRLLYTNAEATWVVDVQGGVPSSPRQVWADGDAATSSHFVWSPTGQMLARVAPDAALELIDVRDAPRVLRRIAPGIANPSIRWMSFNSTGTRFAYSGRHSAEDNDSLWQSGLRYLLIEDNTATLAPTSDPMWPPTETADWSPTGSWLAFLGGCADLSGPSGSLIAWPNMSPEYGTAWLPDRPWLLRARRGIEGYRLHSLSVLDVTGARGGAEFRVDDAGPVREVAFRPATELVAYSSGDHIKTVNLAVRGVQQPALFAVLPGVMKPTFAKLQWSGDGRFLATRVAFGPMTMFAGRYSIAVIAAEGRAEGPPKFSAVLLQQQFTDQTTTFAWQY